MTPVTGKPLAMPLPIVMMSGTVPVCSQPNILPVRPKPVIISSAISSAPASWAMSRIAGRNSGGGMTLPAVPCIGSTITAATAPEVAFLMVLRAKSAQARPQLGYSRPNGQR